MRADVSVIIPCFNSSNTIVRALNSVANQSLGIREVIVFDDGSDDCLCTMERIRAFDSLFPITILRSEVNRGVAHARNQAINSSSSKYLAFLDADDVWFPDKIKIQFEFMEVHQSSITGHGYIQETANSASERFTRAPRYKKLSVWDFCLRHVYFTPTVMVTRKSFVPFDESLRRCEDWSCWVENASRQERGTAFFICARLAGGFKPALGHSGLTGSVATLHQGFIEALAKLYTRRIVNWPFYALALSVEYLKLVYRFIRIRSYESYIRRKA